MDTREKILDASEKIEYTSIFETINECFGTNYSGWMMGCWPNTNGNGNFRAWFPKLAGTVKGKLQSAAFDCVNTISDDWSEVIFDDLKGKSGDMENKYWGYDLIFAKEPKGGPYIFRGVYVRDGEKSKPNHDVSKRIATRVKLIGSPAMSIELIDNLGDSTIRDDINIPMLPKSIEKQEDGFIIMCGRCESKFLEAPRCPECGQLVLRKEG